MNFSRFESLPDCVVRQICCFLELPDFYALRETNKSLYFMYSNFATPYLNSFVTVFIPFNFELYTELGHLEDYIKSLKSNWMVYLDLEENKPFIKKCLQRFAQIKINATKTLNFLNEPCVTSSFLKNLFENLRNPEFPMPKLRREGVGKGAISWIQNYYVDVLYDRERPNERQIEWFQAPFNNFLRLNQSKIVDELLQVKEEVLIVKWNLHGKYNDEGDEQCNGFIHSHWILDIIQLFVSLAHLLCDTYCFFINSQTTIFEIINQYNLHWNSYSAIAIDFDYAFKVISEIIDAAYCKGYHGYPLNPEFSFVRMMNIIWIEYVYEPIKHKVFFCFNKIISFMREKNLEILMNEIPCEKNEGMDLPNLKKAISDMPNSLYFQKSFQKRPSVSEDLLDLLSNIDKSFFYQEFKYLNSLMASFINCLTDLSIHEISIHFIEHKGLQVPENSPYEEIEQLFFDVTEFNFYKSISNTFSNHLNQFKKSIDEDFNYFQSIFKRRTNYKIELIKAESEKAFIRQTMKNHIIEYLLNPDKFPSELHAVIDTDNENMLRNLIAEIISEKSEQFKIVNYGFKKIYEMIEIQSLFSYHNHKEIELFSIKNEVTLDEEMIEYENTERGLQMSMPPKFLKYYSLNYSLTVQDLEETKMEFLSTQNASDSSDYSDSNSALQDSYDSYYGSQEELEEFNDDEEEDGFQDLPPIGLKKNYSKKSRRTESDEEEKCPDIRLNKAISKRSKASSKRSLSRKSRKEKEEKKMEIEDEEKLPDLSLK